MIVFGCLPMTNVTAISFVKLILAMSLNIISTSGSYGEKEGAQNTPLRLGLCQKTSNKRAVASDRG